MDLQLQVEQEDTRPRWLRWLLSKPVRRTVLAVLGAAAPFACLYIPGAIPQQICQAVAAVLFV